jgi:TonB family protein
MSWLGETDDASRRRFRLAVLGSLAAHVIVVVLLSFAPRPQAMLLSQAITVDLVAAVPSPPSAAPKAAPAKPAPPKPAPPPPPPKPKVKILPKEAPTPVVQAKPKPEPKPPPKPEPIVKRPERPKELSLDDALAQLQGEVGEESLLAPPKQVVANAPVNPTPATSSRTGVLVSPEVAAWNLAVMRHIRSVWITPPEFRRSGLAAQLEIDVAVDGRVLGSPKLVRSSGNPFFDDNAIRAVVRASPLPPAPKAGRRTLIFTSEE